MSTKKEIPAVVSDGPKLSPEDQELADAKAAETAAKADAKPEVHEAPDTPESKIRKGIAAEIERLTPKVKKLREGDAFDFQEATEIDKLFQRAKLALEDSNASAMLIVYRDLSLVDN